MNWFWNQHDHKIKLSVEQNWKKEKKNSINNILANGIKRHQFAFPRVEEQKLTSLKKTAGQDTKNWKT